MLGYDNVGKKLSTQIAKEHCGLIPDYTGLERALVTMLHDKYVEAYIKTAVSTLESFGITIDKPKLILNNMKTNHYACLTGSPKEFGYKTKEEFINKFSNIVEVSITDKNCQYLITDSYDSTSSKMKTAEKKGIEIVTYEDFNDIVKEEADSN
jgi:NAD-dependent DNA ligase